MTFLQNALIFIWQALLQELIVVVAGVIIAHLILNWWKERRYGNWHALIRLDDKTLLDRPLSANKAQALLSEPADLNVFLKGLVSPFANVQCDLVTQGKECGVYTEDHQNRQMIVDIIAPFVQAKSESKPPL